MPIDLVLWGATGQARMLAELFRDSKYRLAAVVDRAVPTAPFADVVLLRDRAALEDWLSTRQLDAPVAGLVAVGGGRGGERRALQSQLRELGFQIPVAVHRTAYVADDAEIGAGSQLLPGARVCSHARIGEAVIINTGASVDHDCVVDDGAHLAPGVTLAGEVRVERDAFLGTGAVVLPRLVIGAGATIGAGAVVIRSVEAGGTVVGNPARLIDKN